MIPVKQGMYNANDLQKQGQDYLTFVDLVGQSNEATFDKQLPLLFAKDCKNIASGRLLTCIRDEFKKIWMDNKRDHKNWCVKPNARFFPCISQDLIVIEYIIKTSQKVKFIVIAILKINPEGLIAEVTELSDRLGEDRSHY